VRDARAGHLLSGPGNPSPGIPQRGRYRRGDRRRHVAASGVAVAADSPPPPRAGALGILACPFLSRLLISPSLFPRPLVFAPPVRRFPSRSLSFVVLPTSPLSFLHSPSTPGCLFLIHLAGYGLFARGNFPRAPSSFPCAYGGPLSPYIGWRIHVEEASSTAFSDRYGAYRTRPASRTGPCGDPPRPAVGPVSGPLDEKCM